MTSKADDACRIIKDKIVTLQLKPSSDISEDELIKELNISRTPIREAIQKLAKDRFVIVYPRKGTVVSEISLDLINSIYEVRLLNEPHMARNACMRVSDEWLRMLKKGFLDFKGKEDLLAYIDLDYELHKGLTSYTNNIFLKNMFSVVNDHNHRIRIQTSKRNRDYQRSVQEHLLILEAMERRDEDAVEQAVRDHVLTAKQEAFEYYY